MRIAICEDEISQAQIIDMYLRKMTTKYPIEDILIYTSGEALYHQICEEQKFDFYLLDIQLPGVSGIELASMILEADPNAEIVFITDYTKYIQQAFSLNSAQYLLKPVKSDTFIKTMGQLFEAHSKRCLTFMPENERLLEVPVQDIVYVEFYYGEIIITTCTNTHRFRADVRREKRNLEAFRFLRPHQGYYVNPNYVRKIGADYIDCGNNVRVPISTRQRRKLIDDFNRYFH